MPVSPSPMRLTNRCGQHRRNRRSMIFRFVAIPSSPVATACFGKAASAAWPRVSRAAMAFKPSGEPTRTTMSHSSWALNGTRCRCLDLKWHSPWPVSCQTCQSSQARLRQVRRAVGTSQHRKPGRDQQRQRHGRRSGQCHDARRHHPRHQHRKHQQRHIVQARTGRKNMQ